MLRKFLLFLVVLSLACRAPAQKLEVADASTDATSSKPQMFGAPTPGQPNVAGTSITSWTWAETSSHTYLNACGAPITVTYSMVGGGGGAGGCPSVCANGGGGGSSAVVNAGALVAAGNGGAGGGGASSGAVLTPGSPGVSASGTTAVAVGAALTVYTGGGGGAGPYNYGGGGGSGYFGGGGGGNNTTPVAGGGTGTAGGAAGTNAVSGAQFTGGKGNFSTGSQGTASNGGVQGAGGAGAGGGGYGGGGGSGYVNSAGTSTSGGSNGASAANVNEDGGIILGGLGAITWASATTLPTAAGLGGQAAAQGGNAGLVILSYTPPTGTACLVQSPTSIDSCVAGADGSACTVLHSLPQGGNSIATVTTLDTAGINAQLCEYAISAACGADAGGKTTKAATAILACSYTDAGADATFAIPTITTTTACNVSVVNHAQPKLGQHSLTVSVDTRPTPGH